MELDMTGVTRLHVPLWMIKIVAGRNPANLIPRLYNQSGLSKKEGGR
ncbi:MAG: hypothetical protein HQ579_02755 [Candidatus Omnitrophica bacterium]|nr:hypothetical protein [Candidatus Omnitrophota bacterium]